MTDAKKPAAKKAPAKRAPRKRKPKAPALDVVLDKAEEKAPEPAAYEITEGVTFYGPHGTVYFPRGKIVERAGYRRSWHLVVEAIAGKAKPVG